MTQKNKKRRLHIMSRNKCLTLFERNTIEKGILNGATKSAIAQTIGKDASTVAKEIKLHRTLSYKCVLPLECANYKKCKHSRKCHKACEDFVLFQCKRRDRSPGACNGCSKYNSCRFNKYRYYAYNADRSYKSVLVSSREGFNIDESEIKELLILL
jgi:hypothetical protein